MASHGRRLPIGRSIDAQAVSHFSVGERNNRAPLPPLSGTDDESSDRAVLAVSGTRGHRFKTYPGRRTSVDPHLKATRLLRPEQPRHPVWRRCVGRSTVAARINRRRLPRAVRITAPFARTEARRPLRMKVDPTRLETSRG